MQLELRRNVSTSAIRPIKPKPAKLRDLPLVKLAWSYYHADDSCYALRIGPALRLTLLQYERSTDAI